MRAEQNDLACLWDMIEAVRGIETSVRGLSFSHYLSDENLRLAVERRIEILGEAARRISDAFREVHPEVPWRQIIAQRNVLAHQYDDIDDQLVWRLVQENLAPLRRVLEALLTIPPPDVTQAD